MNDTKLYEQILGLQPPWSVQTVTLKKAEGIIEVMVACAETTWGCPECGQRMHVHGSERRRWRHLDSCQYKTIVVADVPRVKCEAHGTQMVRVPWAEARSRFTTWFERLAIDVLLECSIQGACEILRISWSETDGIKQRAIERGLARKQPGDLRRLCVDEKGVGHGQDYVTVVAKVEAGRSATVEYVGDGREEETLSAYWQSLSAEQLERIEAVGMDMWEPYMNSTLAHLPAAVEKIVHDPFHVACHVQKALNEVRKQEHRELTRDGDNSLKGTKRLWLYGAENLPPSQADAFDILKSQKLKTGRAWAMKEMFRDFWKCETVQTAEEFFADWYGWAIRSRLKPMLKVARMIKEHLANILTYFRHHLSNAAIEGLNNLIQGLIKKAYGYRNRERFKRDILFHAGGLELHPQIIQ
jgi:transposase